MDPCGIGHDLQDPRPAAAFVPAVGGPLGPRREAGPVQDLKRTRRLRGRRPQVLREIHATLAGGGPQPLDRARAAAAVASGGGAAP